MGDCDVITLDGYQDAAKRTAKFNPIFGYLYPVLGLAGETGEVAEKIVGQLWPNGVVGITSVESSIYAALQDYIHAAKRCEFLKKLLRDCADDIPEHHKDDLAERIVEANERTLADGDGFDPTVREIGDVLWYLATLAGKLGYKLSDVARMNIAKLNDRKSRNVLHGSGDTR